jgi:hypothetical protein
MIIAPPRNAVLLAILTTCLPSAFVPSARAIPRTWIGNDANWDNDSTKWSPTGLPFGSDEAIFNTPNTVELGIKQSVNDLTLSSGIDLSTNGFLLIASDITSITGDGTVLHIEGASSTLDGRTVTLNSSGAIQLDAGTLRVVTSTTSPGVVDINPGTTISGHGTVRVDGSPSTVTTVIINDGAISATSTPLIPGDPPPVGSLFVSAPNVNVRIDLDGQSESGVLNVGRNQTLTVEGIMLDNFSATLNMAQNSAFGTSRQPWYVNGSLMIDNGLVDNPSPDADIPAGPATILTAITQEGGTITVADNDGALIFEGPAQIRSNLVNHGLVRFDAGSFIHPAANFTMPTDSSSITVGPSVMVTFAQPNFDLDGNGTETNVVTLQTQSQLYVNIGAGGDDTITGTINFTGATLQVTTADNNWHLQGNVNVSADPKFSMITGESLIVDGATIDIAAGAQLFVNTVNQWNPGTSVSIAAGSLLSLNTNATVNSGAQFIGAGTLRFNSHTTLNNATVATEIFDWDGESNLATHTIPAGSTFTINSPVFDTDGDMDDTFSLAPGATLTVNGPTQWILEGTLNAGAPTAAVAAVVAGSSDLLQQGTINVDGNTEISADVTFGATSLTSIDATTTLKLSGATKQINPGAGFNGAGTLLNSAGSSTLILQNGADVDVRLRNEASLAIGDNVPAHASGSDFVQTVTGTWIVDINGTTAETYDRLNLTGAAQTAGKLDINLGGGYMPTFGDEFEILSAAGGITGAFTILQPAGLPAGLFFTALNDSTTLKLILTDAIPGDFNRDDVVDAADYLIWRKLAGTSVAEFTSADGDGNGLIDDEDYNIWRRHFGTTTPAGGSGNNQVPEPTALAALPLAIMAITSRRRRSPLAV